MQAMQVQLAIQNWIAASDQWQGCKTLAMLFCRSYVPGSA
jgi:hypothetical protein